MTQHDNDAGVDQEVCPLTIALKPLWDIAGLVRAAKPPQHLRKLSESSRVSPAETLSRNRRMIAF